MRAIIRRLAAMAMVTAPLCGNAQQSVSDEPETYIYATYYVCDLNRQEDMDRLVERAFTPLYEEAVRAGELTGWGWLSHHTGGRWRRLHYFSAESIDALLEAQANISEREDERAREQFNAACGAHDDYIWRRLAAGGESDARGKVSLSTYYVCDIGREDRANEIFATTLAPILDEQVRSGLIRSWGWNEHVVGGEFRRLATVTADDWPNLFRAIEAYVSAAGATELGREQSEICNSHVDYLWNIVSESN